MLNDCEQATGSQTLGTKPSVGPEAKTQSVRVLLRYVITTVLGGLGQEGKDSKRDAFGLLGRAWLPLALGAAKRSWTIPCS